MLTVTEQKPNEEILKFLEPYKNVYIIGCGTCPTMLHTGGKEEVLKMKQTLEQAGKTVTGWMVIPTVCDTLTKDALDEQEKEIGLAQALLIMSCAFGVQTVSLYKEKKAIYPALNTLFMGREEKPGKFTEICAQCGQCKLGKTAAICPLVRCAKSLQNGPCGGSVNGKCEVDPNTPCAWQLIIDRLSAIGELNKLEEIEPPQDWSKSHSGGPRRMEIGV
jgi:hypothetical protein